MARPKVLTNPVANQYAGPNERIIEYSARVPNGTVGGLIALRVTDEGKLILDLYNHDKDVEIRVAEPN